MNSRFTRLISYFLVSSFAIPASIFAQPLNPAELKGQTPESQVTHLASHLAREGSQFSFSPSTEIRNSVSPEMLSHEIQRSKITQFYTLLPFDSSLHAQLGTRTKIVSKSLNGISVLTEMMFENKQTRNLESFPHPVKKLISIDFAHATAVQLKLEIDQVTRSAYALASKQTRESFTQKQKLQNKAEAILASLFMPSAQALPIVDLVANAVYGLILVAVLGTGVSLVTQLWSSRGSEIPLSKKEISVKVALILGGVLTAAAIASYENSVSYGQD